MFPVLSLPLCALQLVLAKYCLHEKINFSLVCARAKRALRLNTPANAVTILKVEIKRDTLLNSYVEIYAINEQGERVGNWTFYKKGWDERTEQIIGDTYVQIDLSPYSTTTNVQTFHTLRSAAAFIDHIRDIYPNLIVDVSFDDLSSLDFENKPLINRWISQAREIKFNKCTIPEQEMLTVKELFKPHHRLFIKESQFKFSQNFFVQSIKLRRPEFWEDFTSKNFHLFQCEEFDHDGYFSNKQILKILRTWKNGNNPFLKLIRLNCYEQPENIFSPLNAKECIEPGPRVFRLRNFELDCAGGRDMRGPKKAIGTLNFRQIERGCHRLLFVVWN